MIILLEVILLKRREAATCFSCVRRSPLSENDTNNLVQGIVDVINDDNDDDEEDSMVVVTMRINSYYSGTL